MTLAYYSRLRSGPARSLLLACSFALSGCGLMDRLNPSTVSARGLDPSVEGLNYENVAKKQAALITELGNMAQVNASDLQYQDPRWELIMKSGIALVGGQCNEYLTALFRFDRDNKAIRTGLTATSTAATTIMGLAGTAANPIAATAAVFGLGEAFFDANVNAVVFQIGPAAVRNIVVASQDAYRGSVMTNIKLYQSRPDVIIGLQGYLQLCTPVAIESAVEAGASTIAFDLKAGPTTADSQPALRQISVAAGPIAAQGRILSSTRPPVQVDAITNKISDAVAVRRKALIDFVKKLALAIKPGDPVADSDLRKVALALGVQPSDDPAEQRDRVIGYIQGAVNSSDPARAAQEMQGISKALSDAGIQNSF